MTLEEIALSRAAMALPGAPKPPKLPPYSRPIEVHMGASTRRDGAGILWVDVAAKDSANYDWSPDLDDAATGGVLVEMLGIDAGRIAATVSTHKRAAGLRWWADLTVEDGSDCRRSVATLAEAACCVAVVVGRWAGGS